MTDATEKPFNKGMLVTWGLNLATTVALAVAGHLASQLTGEIKALGGAVSTMQAQVAVLNERVDRASSIEGRVFNLDAASAAQRVEIESLKDRLRALEGRK